MAFCAAYLDRSESAFKKTVDSLVWHSFVWFASEPENLTMLNEGEAKAVTKLADFIGSIDHRVH